MTDPNPLVEANRRVRRGMFLIVLVLINVAFFHMITNFLMAVFWAVILAVIFSGINSRLLSRTGRRNLSAMLTCTLIILTVVIPMVLIGVAVVDESARFYNSVTTGSISIDDLVDEIRKDAPAAIELLGKAGITEEEITSALRNFVASLVKGIGDAALKSTKGILGFLVQFSLMLYLMFFFIRDGNQIIDTIRQSLPMGDEIENRLFKRFVVVSRATVKGTLIVAVIQGSIGGIAFFALGIPGAILWGVLMVLLALLPVVGTGIVWVPTAIVLAFEGQWTEAIILTFVGLVIIGLVDNLLRPLLVGRETKMPDFLVLLATLGGLAWFGITGFVIGPVLAAFFITCWEIAGQLFGGTERI